MGVSKNRGIPKSSISIGFGTIIFTIHFGGKIPLCLVQHPYKCSFGRSHGGLRCVVEVVGKVTGKVDGPPSPKDAISNDVPKQVEASSASWMRLDGKDQEKGVFFFVRKVFVKLE